ncbi:MAG: type II toxin-antitoxin system RelE/ParE family toxin [Rhizobiaceae bacterium]|nr:type II toxin-antitoxin system RelE/ParE family toxin [Rhizobiaceae bacterium]
MTREIRLSEAARSDLIDIWVETDRQWGPDQADRYLDDIEHSLSGLIDNPQIGTDCSDLLPGCRRLIAGRHLAFYEVDGAAIFVIRVLHQSMDVPRHLRDR